MPKILNVIICIYKICGKLANNFLLNKHIIVNYIKL